MAAATNDIDTPQRAGEVNNFPLAAAALIYAGVLVATDAAGNLNPASDTAALTVQGRAEVHTDNTGGAAGAMACPVRRGVFGFLNDISANALTAADVGKTIACVLDDQTVTRAAGTANAVKAGLLVSLEAGYAWVDTRQHTL